MNTFTKMFLMLCAVLLVGGTGCASVDAFNVVPLDPVSFVPESVPIATLPAPLAQDEAGGGAVDTDEEGIEYEDYKEGEGEGEGAGPVSGELGEYPFDKVGRMEIGFDILYRDRNHKGSDQWSEERILRPEIGIVVHKYFEALAGIGFYWLRGQEKAHADIQYVAPLKYITGASFIGGTIPGHYRIEERYLEFGGRVNLPIPNAPLFVPFAELKLGLGMRAEWNRVRSLHDWGFRDSFALGARIFVNEERSAAVLIKYNFSHAKFSEKEITMGERSDRELTFGMTFFF